MSKSYLVQCCPDAVQEGRLSNTGCVVPHLPHVRCQTQKAYMQSCQRDKEGCCAITNVWCCIALELQLGGLKAIKLVCGDGAVGLEYMRILWSAGNRAHSNTLLSVL